MEGGHKIGPRDNVEHYSPISLSCMYSKTMKQIIPIATKTNAYTNYIYFCRF